MTGDRANGERLVSRAEIADLADVTRPTPNTWERRNRDFPKPLTIAGKELFRLDEVLSWLEARTVPRNARTPDEAVGTTYADRIRRHLAGSGSLRAQVAGTVAARRTDTPVSLEAQRRTDLLVAPVIERLRDRKTSGHGYLTVLLAAILLRRAQPEHWAALLAEMPSPHEQVGLRNLLRRIGSAADAVLHDRGLPTGVEEALAFWVEDARDLERILRACDGVPADELWSWLDAYRSELSWHGDYFTPSDLADLMVSLVVAAREGRPAEGPLRCYDPHARAGELLAAAAWRVSEPRQLVLRGNTTSDQACALAALNLALHNVSPRLDVYGRAPWDHPDWSPPGADIVLSNPWFGRSNPAERRRRDGEWPFGPPPLGSDSFAWLQLCVESLAPTGQAVVVMPANAAFSTARRETDIRREMVERGAVEAIVALPARLFPGIAVATCLWLMRAPTGSCDGVLFVDARRYGTLTRGRSCLAPAETEAIQRAYLTFRRDREMRRAHAGSSGFSRAVDLTEIRARNYSLLAEDYQLATPEPTTEAATAVAEARDRLSRARARAAKADAKADSVALTAADVSRPSGGSLTAPEPVPLGSLCTIQAGPSYSRLTSQVRSSEGDVPVVLPKHLRSGRIIAVDCESVPTDLAQRLERFRLATGDVLCVRSGAMGHLAVVEEAQAGWLFSTNLLRLRPRTPDAVDPAYLLAYLALPSVAAWIRQSSVRTVVATLRSNDLAKLRVPLPPLTDQHRIAAAIAALDARTQSYQDLASASVHARTVLSEHLMNGEQVHP